MSAVLQKQPLSLDIAEVFTPLLDDDARYLGAYGGRGSGKSHFFADRAVITAVSRPRIRIVCIREVQRSLRLSSTLLIEDKIAKHGLGRYFDVMDKYIRIRSSLSPVKGIIAFQGMQDHTAESIKSLEGFEVGWLEEAQSISNRSLELLRPTFREETSQLWFSWNPRRPTDPVDAFLRGKELPPGAVVVQANYYDNPWFPEVLRREMEWDKRRDPEKYQHVWLGGYERRSEARVFHNWRVEEFETPVKCVFLFGADWGFSQDPTVLVRMFVDHGRRTIFIDREAWKIGCSIENSPFLFAGMNSPIVNRLNGAALEKLQKAGVRFEGIPGCENWTITADSARPETIDYMKRHGFPKMRPSVKGPNSVNEGVEFMKSYDIVVHPRCKHVIDELSSYRYKVDPHTDEVTNILEDKKNHTIDAIRYGVEQLRRRRTAGSW